MALFSGIDFQNINCSNQRSIIQNFVYEWAACVFFFFYKTIISKSQFDLERVDEEPLRGQIPVYLLFISFHYSPNRTLPQFGSNSLFMRPIHGISSTDVCLLQEICPQLRQFNSLSFVSFTRCALSCLNNHYVISSPTVVCYSSLTTKLQLT